MKELDLRQLEHDIEGRRAETERKVLASKLAQRASRARPRDMDEQAILDRIAIRKWTAAEEAGKVKYLSKTEWYYEY